MMQISSQKGFTLIEVLIAVLVLGIGLLGLAALQTAGIRSNQNAYLRSQATIMAYDMIDRMRANYEGSFNVAYDDSVDNLFISCAKCSPQQIAQNDLYEWRLMLSQTLPGGNGVVCIDSSPNDGDSPPGDPGCDPSPATVTSSDVYAVKIWWDERVGEGETAQKLFVVSAQPVIP
jgi:type IV pilus assembly protein PilV